MFKRFARRALKKNSPDNLKNSEELFSSGEIFTTKDKKLDNILTQLATNRVVDGTHGHKEVIRAITILAIRNNRYTERLQIFNIILAAVTIILAIYSIRLTKVQTDYTEVSTRSDRIQQNALIRSRAEYCKQNPDSKDSQLANPENGVYVSCADALKMPQIQKILEAK